MVCSSGLVDNLKSGIERSLSWLGGVQRCLHAERHCPFWYCGNRPLQLSWPMRSEVAMIFLVRVWIYSVCSRDFSERSIGQEI